MAIDPPYRLDPFRNIVAIHWETSTAVGPILALFTWNPIGGGAIEDGLNILNGWAFDSVWDWQDTGGAAAYFAKIAEMDANGYHYAGEAYYMIQNTRYDYWPSLSICQANAIDFSAYIHWGSSYNFFGIWDMVNINSGLWNNKAYVQCSLERITE